MVHSLGGGPLGSREREGVKRRGALDRLTTLSLRRGKRGFVVVAIAIAPTAALALAGISCSDDKTGNVGMITLDPGGTYGAEVQVTVVGRGRVVSTSPGIVHKITSYLHEQGVNVEELETHLESAPFMGTPVFTMEIVMLVPKSASVKALRRALEELGDTLNCDVDLDPA